MSRLQKTFLRRRHLLASMMPKMCLKLISLLMMINHGRCQSSIGETVNLSDHPPVFLSSVYNASIPEEVEDPIRVTQVTATDLDLSENEAESLLRYSIKSPKEAPFRIDRSGVIWTTAKIDRETTSEFILDVMVEDEQGLSGLTVVHVKILDANDNPPRFTRLFSSNISESAPAGSFVIQVTSSDRDSEPSFSEATYSFIGSSDPFEIEPHTGKVFLMGSLDRESKDEYLLVVAVNDSSWRAQTTLTITILDENDSDPKFEFHQNSNRNSNPFYEFKKSLSLNSKDLKIGQVRASDADLGINSAIGYSIKSSGNHHYNNHNSNQQQQLAINEIFVINTHTGEMSLKPASLTTLISNMMLSLESGSDQPNLNYNLTVIATDGGHPSRSAESLVMISLTPHDLTSSSSSLSSGPSSSSGMTYSVDVQSSGNNHQIMIPVPFDLQNETILYSLRSQMSVRSLRNNHHNRHIIQILGAKVLFFGSNLVAPGERYSYQLMSMSEIFNLTLLIVNPNVHEPKFENSKYQIMTPENRDRNEVLAHFTAEDSDPDEPNRLLSYSYKIIDLKWNERSIDYYNDQQKTQTGQQLMNIRSNDQINDYFRMKLGLENKILNPFFMDPESGGLYLSEFLDYEMIISYQIQVTAKDSAAFDSKNSSTMVYIHVTDVNDNKPIFSNLKELENGMEVYENNLIGQIIGEVHAVDYDSLPNSQITYELEPKFDHDNFSISAKTGQIQALASLDYEKSNTYTISIVAKNDESVKRSILLKIRVKDINEFDTNRSNDVVSFGVIVVIIFFVILILIIAASMIFLQKQKKSKLSQTDSRNPLSSIHTNSSTPRKMPSTGLPPLSALNAMKHHMVHHSGASLLHPNHHHPHPHFNQLHRTMNNSLMHTGHPLNQQPNTMRPHHHLPPHPHHPHAVAAHQLQHFQRQASAHTLSKQQNLTIPTNIPQVSQNSNHTPNSQNGNPDVIHEQNSQNNGQHSTPPNHSNTATRVPPAPPSSFVTPSDNYSEILNPGDPNYDLENSSSIAPSELDDGLVYHHHHLNHLTHHRHRFPGRAAAAAPPLPPVPISPSNHHHLNHLNHLNHHHHNKPDHRHVPLARLSPSVSEVTAPRILTLHDLSPSTQMVSGPIANGSAASSSIASPSVSQVNGTHHHMRQPSASPVNNNSNNAKSSTIKSSYHNLQSVGQSNGPNGGQNRVGGDGNVKLPVNHRRSSSASGTGVAASDSSDEDDAATIDSFTSSEYDDHYPKLNQKMIFQRV